MQLKTADGQNCTREKSNEMWQVRTFKSWEAEFKEKYNGDHGGTWIHR